MLTTRIECSLGVRPSDRVEEGTGVDGHRWRKPLLDVGGALASPGPSEPNIMHHGYGIAYAE